MKKFSFNLESVLAYRKLLEEGEQEKLHAIDSTIQRVRQVMASLLSETARHSQMLTSQKGATLDVDSLKNLSSYLGKLRTDISEITRRLSRLDEDRRVQLDKLIRAKTACEIVQTLKDKKLTRYEKETLAMEQKLLDDVSAARFSQR